MKLPIQICTICLDGEPYIERFLPVFDKLSIPWFWRVAEGASDNTHCTSWCQKQIPRFSRDGSSEYLTRISKHPNVRIYRRQLWDGKVSMFNAMLSDIKEDCVLLMPDVDEHFTAEQIEKIVKLFEDRPAAMRALFYCRYFIGPNILATGDNCWGNRGGIEWLRAFRFRVGNIMSSHEPPVLAGNKGLAISRDETHEMGLVFDHFSWALESNVLAKLRFYGYGEKYLEGWKRLQANTNWPISDLKEFFPWVGNGVTADLFENVYPNEINPTSKFNQ